jgi:hypothetical protein
MKKYKFLTAAMAAAALSGVSALAQFNYQNGDLIAAFGNGGTTDVIVNLGTLSNFTFGSPNTWNLNSVLDATFGSTSGVYWAVFGVNNTSQPGYDPLVTQTSPYTVWSTLAENPAGTQNVTPPVSGDVSSQHAAANQIVSILNFTSPGEAGAGQIVDYSPGIEQVATSLGGFSSLMNNAGAGYNGNLAGTWSYNMLNTGPGTSDFYQNDPPTFYNQVSSTPATYLGNFALDGSGDLAFNPVPEPSSWVMMGSGMLALFAIRRRKS